MQQDRTIKIMQKKLGCLIILGNYRLGMAGAMLRNMRYGLSQIIYRTH